MTAITLRVAAKLISTLMVTVVRFHMRGTPFLDHAGAAHKGCVKRTIEGLARPSWQHRSTFRARDRFQWPRWDPGSCITWRFYPLLARPGTGLRFSSSGWPTSQVGAVKGLSCREHTVFNLMQARLASCNTRYSHPR